MDPEERAVLQRCMAAMAAGDAAFVFTFIEHFGGHLAGVVRRVVVELGRRDVLADFGEIDGLVHDAAFFIFDRAGAWNPDGALPWVWAERGIRNEISVHIGPRVTDNGDDLESEVGAGAAAGIDLGPGDIAAIGRIHPELDLLMQALRHVTSERNADVYVQYRLQQRLGDHSPANTVAVMFGLQAANVRQICHRVSRQLRPVLERVEYQSIAALPLLVA